MSLERRYHSAEDRTYASENPFVVLGITPPTSEEDIDAVRTALINKHRALSLIHHPDRTTYTHPFVEIQQAHDTINNAETQRWKDYGFQMVFGPECVRWTNEMKDAAKPLVDALVRACTVAKMSDGDTVACASCNETGKTLVRADQQYFGIPAPCSCCGGEGAIPAAIVALRSSMHQKGTDPAILAPHWIVDELDAPALPSAEECALTRPLSKDLPEALERYVLSNPYLCTRQFMTEMCARLVSIVNQAMENRKGFSALHGYNDNVDVVKRIVQDCSLGISYVESRKGARDTEHMIAVQDWAKLIGIGRTLRMKIETQIVELEKQNSIPFEADKVIAGMGKSKEWSTYVHSEAMNLARISDVATYRDYLAYQKNTAHVCAAMDFVKQLAPLHEVSRAQSNSPGIEWLTEPAYGGDTLGTAEMALFTRVFSETYGCMPESLMTLPENTFETFSRIFRYEEGEWSVDEEEEQKLMKTVERLFPGQSSAWGMLCDLFVGIERRLEKEMMEQTMSERYLLPKHFQHRAKDPRTESVRSVFPSSSSLSRHYQLNDAAQSFTLAVSREGAASTDQFGMGPVNAKPLPAPAKLLKYSAQELVLAAHDHSSVFEWHNVVMDPDPKTLATVVNTLFQSDDVPSRSLACNMMLLCLSTEPLKRKDPVAVDELFWEKSRLYGQLAKNNAKTFQLLELIDDEILQYLNVYSSILSENYDSLEKLFAFLDEHTVFAPQNAMHLWHPVWQHEPNAYYTEKVLTMIEQQENITGVVHAMSENYRIRSETWADLILGAEKYDEDGKLGYTNTLLLEMSALVARSASTEALATFVQDDSGMNDLWEAMDYPNPEKKREAFLDLPRDFLFQKKNGRPRGLPQHWKNTRNFLQKVDTQRPALFNKTVEKPTNSTLATYSSDYVKHPDVFHVKTLLPHPFTEDDLIMLEALTAEEHPYMELIRDNAIRSTRTMQVRLLSEQRLPVDDATQVALALIRNAVQKGKGTMTCAQFAGAVAGESVPKKYAFIAEACASSEALKKNLLRLLLQQREKPLTDLSLEDDE